MSTKATPSGSRPPQRIPVASSVFFNRIVQHLLPYRKRVAPGSSQFSSRVLLPVRLVLETVLGHDFLNFWSSTTSFISHHLCKSTPAEREVAWNSSTSTWLLLHTRDAVAHPPRSHTKHMLRETSLHAGSCSWAEKSRPQDHLTQHPHGVTDIRKPHRSHIL